MKYLIKNAINIITLRITGYKKLNLLVPETLLTSLKFNDFFITTCKLRKSISLVMIIISVPIL